MGDAKVCVLCGVESPEVRNAIIHWTDPGRGFGGWEAVVRCPDREACHARVIDQDGTWDVIEGRWKPEFSRPTGFRVARQDEPYADWAARQGPDTLDKSVPTVGDATAVSPGATRATPTVEEPEVLSWF